MERIDLDVLVQALQDLGITISRAKAFVEEGKEIYCGQKLQGAIVKCENVLKYVDSFRVENTPKDGDDGIVANKSQQT